MQTLQSFINQHGIKMECKWADENPNNLEWMAGCTHWKCRFRRKGTRRCLTIPFSMGPAHFGEPKAKDVLSCLASDASSADESFEEWAPEYGYDADSCKAEKIYKAVCRQTEQLKKFLDPELFQQLLYNTEPE